MAIERAVGCVRLDVLGILHDLLEVRDVGVIERLTAVDLGLCRWKRRVTTEAHDISEDLRIAMGRARIEGVDATDGDVAPRRMRRV